MWRAVAFPFFAKIKNTRMNGVSIVWLFSDAKLANAKWRASAVVKRRFGLPLKHCKQPYNTHRSHRLTHSSVNLCALNASHSTVVTVTNQVVKALLLKQTFYNLGVNEWKSI